MNAAGHAHHLLTRNALPQAPLLVGYSGGLDSTVLLHLLAGCGARMHGLRAVHVHHGLQAMADDWAARCAGFCASLGVELAIIRVEVARNAGVGPEAAAREARYRAFVAQLREGEQLVLGHHRDDQAETVLLRLLRGSGSDGLSAMRDRRDIAGHVLWRPLLALPRARLLDYARDHGLSWIEDPSNADERLDRNFLRQRVLPLLSERWPQAATALAHSAAWLREDAWVLGQEADRRLAQAQGLDAEVLSVAALLRQDPAWRPRLIRRWLSGLGLPLPPREAHGQIESALLGSRPDAEPEFRWRGCVLRRWRDLLHAERENPGFPPGWCRAWTGMAPLRLPTGDSLCWQPWSGAEPAAAPGTEALIVRARRGGERIRLEGRQHRHALKKLLQDHGVPPWERERMPLLFSEDGELLAAADLILSARWLQQCRDHGRRLRWLRAKAH